MQERNTFSEMAVTCFSFNFRNVSGSENRASMAPKKIVFSDATREFFHVSASLLQ